MLTTIISALAVSGIFSIVLKYYFDHRKLKNDAFSKNVCQILIKEILDPFRFSIEMSLYKIIILTNQSQTNNNQLKIEHALYSMKQLQNKITSNPLLFTYMSDSFLYSLSHTIQSMEQQPPNIKIVNKNFEFFSGEYFELVNKVRKGIFLPPRGDKYRATFHLYKQKNSKTFESKRTRDKLFIFLFIYCTILIAIPIFIAYLIHVSGSLINLIKLFQSLMN